MLRPYTVALLLASLCQFISTALFSQCLLPPPLPTFLGTEPTLSDNETLGVGAEKWFYGGTATYNQVTLRGGKLVIAGDLTFNNFALDSGTVIVRPGARLRIGGGAGIVLRGNAAIYNYGTLEVISNLVMDVGWVSASKPNVLINATSSSVFRMSNQYFVINNPYSFFVNKGSADFHGLITDYGSVAGSVCLGSGSQTTMRGLYNKIRNAYNAPDGPACVQVSQFSQFYEALTASPNVHVCLSASHTSDASCTAFGCTPNAWGAASVFNTCNACAEAQILSLRNARSSPQKTPEQLAIGPNPFAEGIRLSWPHGKKPAEIIVFNTNGRIVYKQAIGSVADHCTIQLPPTLPNGEYIARLVFTDEIMLKKIIKTVHR